MNRKEALRQARQADTLQSLGFTSDEAESLRRISMTLQRWFELECGDSNDYASWAIERDEETDKPYMVRYPHTDSKSYRTRIADRETGARKRLAAIIGQRNMRKVNETPEPETINGCAEKVCDLSLSAYVQTDPRGAALYILRPGDVPEGADVSSYYSRGICVY